MPQSSAQPQKTTQSTTEDNLFKTKAVATSFDQYYEAPNGKKFTVYFPNWSIYSRGFFVSSIPVDYVPDVAYAFYNLDGTGNILSGDTWADFEQRFTTAPNGIAPLDSWNTNNSYYGNFGQFLKLKQQGKKFNLILAIGGWTWSANFSTAVSTAANRQALASNIMNFMNTYPIFSGVAIDWEYITNDGVNHGNDGNISTAADADNFAAFAQLLRQTFNNSGKTQYRIAVCCSGDPKIAPLMKAQNLVANIDEFHLMTYDFADGGWGNTTTAHQCNLKACSYCPFSAEQAVKAYLDQGVPSNKIMIGVAAYSRGFSNTTGPGKPGSGASPDMTSSPGLVDYRQLPKPGATEYWDPNCLGPFSYDASKKVYNSYDNVNSVYEKCKYVLNNNLKGILVWEMSGDTTITDSRSLMMALNKYLITGDARTMTAPTLPPLLGTSTPAPATNTPVVAVPTPSTSTPAVTTPTPVVTTPVPVVTVPSTSTPTVTTPSTNTPSTSVSPWKTNTVYSVGTLVSYNGKTYKNIQAHTSNAAWTPDVTPTLWTVVTTATVPVTTTPAPIVATPVVTVPSTNAPSTTTPVVTVPSTTTPSTSTPVPIPVSTLPTPSTTTPSTTTPSTTTPSTTAPNVSGTTVNLTSKLKSMTIGDVVMNLSNSKTNIQITYI